MSETVVLVDFDGRVHRQLPKWWPLRKDDVCFEIGTEPREILWPRPAGSARAVHDGYYREYEIESHVNIIFFHGQRMERVRNPEKVMQTDDAYMYIEGTTISVSFYDDVEPDAGSFWTKSEGITREVIAQAVEDNPLPCSTCGRDVRIAKNLLECRKHYITTIAELEAEVTQLRLRVLSG